MKERTLPLMVCCLLLLTALACNLGRSETTPAATPTVIVQPTESATQAPPPTPTPTPSPVPVIEDLPYEGPAPDGALARIGRGAARTMALSPDGEFIAVATTIGVYLYRTDTMTTVWYTPFRTNVVNVAFSPDGSRLVAPTTAHIYVLDTATGELVGERISNSSLEGIAAFHPEGALLATASNLVIKLWDLDAGAAIAELTGHARSIQSLAWAPDGSVLASGATSEDGEAGEIILWDPDTGEVVRRFGAEHSRAVSALVFDSDGSRLLADAAREVIVWDLSTGTPLHVIESTHIISVAWSPDDARLAFGLNRGRTLVHDAASAAKLYELEDQRIDVRVVAFSPDSRMLYTFDSDGTLYQRDAATGAVLRSAAGFANRLGVGAWTPDGSALWAGMSGGQLVQWDVDSFERRHLEQGFGAPGLTGSTLTALAYHPDRNLLAVGGADGRVYLYDPLAKEVVHAFGDRDTGHRNAIQVLRWSPDGTQLVSGGIDETVIIWDVAAQAPLVRFADADARLSGDLDFTPDGSAVVVASRDHSIYVLDPTTGAIGRQWNPDQGAQRGLGWHPTDSNRFVTASMRVVIWDLTSGEPVLEMADPRGFNFPYAVAFSPDGALIVAGGSGGDVALWDAATGAAIAVYERPHTDTVHTIAFSPDGSRFATISFDGTILIWPAP